MQKTPRLILAIMLAGVTSGVLHAQDHESELVTPGLHFQFDKNALYLPNSVKQNNRASNLVQEYGATLSFPIKHKKVSLDLGLDFRFYDKHDLSLSGLPAEQGFGVDLKELPIPMIYATALFELPFEGLSASVSGSHRNLGDQRNADYDFKAKLSFEWKNGIGLEGGWQHQQMNLEQSNDNDVFRMESLFMDMKYKF